MKVFVFISVSFFVLSCQYLDTTNSFKIFRNKKKAVKSSVQEKQTWEQIKNQKNLPFEKRIHQLDQFIQANNNKEVALSAYLLKAELFLKKQQNKKACLTYQQVLKSSFEYSQSWKAYRESATCYFKQAKPLLAFQTLQMFIESSKAKTEEKQSAALMQWSFIKKKKGWVQYKLKVLSSLSFLSSKSEFWLSKGQQIIDKLSLQELTSYTSQTVKFPRFKAYLQYKTGFKFLKERQFKTAESYLKKALSGTLSDSIKKEVKQSLLMIKKISKANPYLIGVILPLSGRRKILGEKVLRGLSIGFDIDQNSSWQLIVLDSKSHPDTMRSHIDELFYEHHVIALVGGLTSETAGVLAQKAEEFSIPTVVLSQKKGLTQNKKFVFQNAITSQQLLNPLIKDLRKNLKIDKVSILYPDDSYGKDYSSFFEESFKESGGQIVNRVMYKFGEVDFKKEVKTLLQLNLKNRKKEFEKIKTQFLKDNPNLSARSKKLTPENLLSIKKDFSAIFIPDSSKALNRISDHFKYFGLKDIYLVGLNLWNIDSIKSKDFSVVFVNLEDQNQNQTEFYRKFVLNYKQAPGHFEQKSYNTAVFLKQVLSQKISSRVLLQKELEKIQEIQGAYSVLSISEDRVFQYPLVVYKKLIDKAQ